MLPNNNIPPSLAIARYLHDYTKEKVVNIVGPFHKGQAHFSDPVIYIDGGTQFRQAKEGLSVGDGDSYPGILDEQLNPHKDFSDLAYVLSSLPGFLQNIHLHGFMGGRPDHEWANLGEAHAFLKTRHKPTQLHFDSIVIGFSAGKWQLSIKALFSLLCLEPCKVKLEGACQYPINQLTQIQPLSSFGLSNEGRGLITLKNEGPVFIVYPDNL